MVSAMKRSLQAVQSASDGREESSAKQGERGSSANRDVAYVDSLTQWLRAQPQLDHMLVHPLAG